jgi:hypothetical protein
MRKQIQIVLVHLGTSQATHLWKNIGYLRKQWPQLKITLIGDQLSTEKKSNDLGISYVDYQPNETEKNLVFSTNHDSSFRKGFWNYSLLRLFAVIRFAEEKETGVVLHIESDVLLMENFPFNVFTELTKPAWLRFNESHDVASIFAIPNKQTALWLRSRFYELLSNGKHLTDMTLLSQISHEEAQRVELLPIAHNEKDLILRKSEISKDELTRVTENYDKYGGVFDSAPIGMWLLGQDPRNHKGKLKRFINLSHSFIQPNQVKLQSIEKERQIMYDQGTPIFDLHVHSKELKYFTNSKALFISTQSSQTLTKAERFLPFTFLRITLDYFNRRGLIKGIIAGVKNLTNRN